MTQEVLSCPHETAAATERPPILPTLRPVVLNHLVGPLVQFGFVKTLEGAGTDPTNRLMNLAKLLNAGQHHLASHQGRRRYAESLKGLMSSNSTDLGLDAAQNSLLSTFTFYKQDIGRYYNDELASPLLLLSAIRQRHNDIVSSEADALEFLEDPKSTPVFRDFMRTPNGFLAAIVHQQTDSYDPSAVLQPWISRANIQPIIERDPETGNYGMTDELKAATKEFARQRLGLLDFDRTVSGGFSKEAYQLAYTSGCPVLASTFRADHPRLVALDANIKPAQIEMMLSGEEPFIKPHPEHAGRYVIVGDSLQKLLQFTANFLRMKLSPLAIRP